MLLSTQGSALGVSPRKFGSILKNPSENPLLSQDLHQLHAHACQCTSSLSFLHHLFFTDTDVDLNTSSQPHALPSSVMSRSINVRTWGIHTVSMLT